MQLLVDIGNSRIKWALTDGYGLTIGDPITNELGRTSFQKLIDIPFPERIVISNTSEELLLKKFCNWCLTTWGEDPLILSPKKIQFGVQNCYDNPDDLGTDRWLALLAARQLQTGALAVVDCGTALTIDGLTSEGQFLGGVIAASPDLILKCLSEIIPRLSSDNKLSFEVFNKNTKDAVGNGSIIFAAAGIDRVLNDFRLRLSEKFSVFLTGGWAHQIAPYLESDVQIFPDLVLQGIKLVADS